MADNSAAERSDLSVAVAAQIRAERAARGWTQAQVEQASGLPHSTYVRIESGSRVVNVSQLHRLARTFGIRPSVLIQRAYDRIDDKEQK